MLRNAQIIGCADMPQYADMPLLPLVLQSIMSSDTLYCTVLYCTVLYCTVLYCTVLYCTVAIGEKCFMLAVITGSHSLMYLLCGCDIPEKHY